MVAVVVVAAALLPPLIGVSVLKAIDVKDRNNKRVAWYHLAPQQ